MVYSRHLMATACRNCFPVPGTAICPPKPQHDRPECLTLTFAVSTPSVTADQSLFASPGELTFLSATYKIVADLSQRPCRICRCGHSNRQRRQNWMCIGLATSVHVLTCETYTTFNRFPMADPVRGAQSASIGRPKVVSSWRH